MKYIQSNVQALDLAFEFNQNTKRFGIQDTIADIGNPVFLKPEYKETFIRYVDVNYMPEFKRYMGVK